MLEFIVGTWHFFQDAGWRGVLCEIFNIDSKHNDMYRIGHIDGMSSDISLLDATILNLACDIPNIEPFRTRSICQIRGFADAKKERSNETKLTGAPHTDLGDTDEN